MQNPLRRAPEREAYFPRIQLKNEEGYRMRRKWNRFVAGLLSIVLPCKYFLYVLFASRHKQVISCLDAGCRVGRSI